MRTESVSKTMFLEITFLLMKKDSLNTSERNLAPKARNEKLNTIQAKKQKSAFQPRPKLYGPHFNLKVNKTLLYHS